MHVHSFSATNGAQSRWQMHPDSSLAAAGKTPCPWVTPRPPGPGAPLDAPAGPAGSMVRDGAVRTPTGTPDAPAARAVRRPARRHLHDTDPLARRAARRRTRHRRRAALRGRLRPGGARGVTRIRRLDPLPRRSGRNRGRGGPGRRRHDAARVDVPRARRWALRPARDLRRSRVRRDRKRHRRRPAGHHRHRRLVAASRDARAGRRPAVPGTSRPRSASPGRR